MKIALIEINQAEGPDPLVRVAHTSWERAAITLHGICLAMEADSPGQGCWKTDVVVHFEGGFWRKYRFDACVADSAFIHSYEKFAANTLLWSTSYSNPEDDHA